MNSLSRDTEEVTICVVGNIPAPAVTTGGRAFQVANNDDFINLATALGRSCDVQVGPIAITDSDKMLTSSICSTIYARTRRIVEVTSMSVIVMHRTISATQISPHDTVSHRTDFVQCGLKIILTVRQPQHVPHIHRLFCSRPMYATIMVH